MNWSAKKEQENVPISAEIMVAPKLNELPSTASYVETVENRIYFYSEIGRTEILQLNKRLRETSNTLLVNAAIQDRKPADIFLHINSFGGSIFAGLSAVDEITSCKVPVVSIVDGCCASAATLMSICATKRIIRPNAFMLIHQLSGCSWGKYRELVDDHANHTKFMETIKAIYKKYTKIPVKKLKEILDHDLWWSSEQCLEYGLVDEIS